MQRLAIVSFIILCAACAQREDLREVTTPRAPAPIGPYSQGVIKANYLFVSGQIGLNSKGLLDSGSIEYECRQAMNNLREVVTAAGYSMNDICKTTLYTTDLKKFSVINKVYADFFSGISPARETVEVRALPGGARFEISAIAVR